MMRLVASITGCMEARHTSNVSSDFAHAADVTSLKLAAESSNCSHILPHASQDQSSQ